MKFGFKQLSERYVPELNFTARMFDHVKSGAVLLSITNDDENKAFSVNFRTPHASSTGIAHIMEHSVLAGSRKYPVKEPFVELMKGSLNTFLNAFTFPDKTCYPVASQNLQDFYNLIDVYLDAAFYPLLPQRILDQEGWHYELLDPDEPIEFKGVVFNEMKGAFSSAPSLLSTYSQKSVFPDNVYYFESGGDPEYIPDLTYEMFKSFHEVFYHPSNARLFFYGNDPEEERLQILDEYLKDFDVIEVNSEVALQPDFAEPKTIEFPYDTGEEVEKKGMVTVNWKLAETTNPEIALGMDILEHLLIGTPASPLNKALIESGIGEDLAGTGLDQHYREMVFSTGLKGIDPEDSAKVESLILDTLHSIVEVGIEKGALDASMNTIEFDLRENNSGTFPRGLLLMVKALTSWNYDGDPVETLAFEKPLNSIKAKLASGERYFEGLIETYFLNNTHRATVVMKPDSSRAAELEAKELARLTEAKSKMTPSEIEEVIKTTKDLIEHQNTADSPEALATIPMLSLKDIEKKIRTIPIEHSKIGNVDVLLHDLFTNGIVYTDIGFNLKTLPSELLPLVKLFGQSLIEMGTKTEDYVVLTQRIGSKTGGISPTQYVASKVNEKGSAAWFLLRGKSTVAQAKELFEILSDILLNTDLDNPERFQQLVLKAKASKEGSLVAMGHRVVNERLKAHFTEAGWVDDQMSGIDNLLYLRELIEEIQNDWGGVLAKLEKIRALLINGGAALCNLTIDRNNYDFVEPHLNIFIDSLPKNEVKLLDWVKKVYPINEGLTIPAQVNYVGKGGVLTNDEFPADGSMLVARKYFGTTWLWEKVRVQGGAYGGFSLWDWVSGVFNYLSYRDPNLEKTLENYDGTVQFLRELEISEDELTKSIIGTIGDIDQYQLPDAKGFTSLGRWLTGVSDEKRQQLRDQVLRTGKDIVNNAADGLEVMNETAHIVVMGSADSIEEAEDVDWKEVIKVL